MNTANQETGKAYTLEEIKERRLMRDCPFVQFQKLNVIYKITNTISGKVYIGLSTSFTKRIKSHLYHAERGGQLHLHRAIKKHGMANFTLEVVEVVSSKQDLPLREEFYITQFRSDIREHGYNMTSGGNTPHPNAELLIERKVSAKGKVAVSVYDLDGMLIQTHESINACAEALGVKHSSVRLAVRFPATRTVKGLYQIRDTHEPAIAPFVAYSRKEAQSQKQKENWTGKVHSWYLENLETGENWTENGLLQLSRVSGRKVDELRALAYSGRGGYKEAKRMFRLTKDGRTN